jgi:hypothetical protein
LFKKANPSLTTTAAIAKFNDVLEQWEAKQGLEVRMDKNEDSSATTMWRRRGAEGTSTFPLMQPPSVVTSLLPARSSQDEFFYLKRKNVIGGITSEEDYAR